MTDHDLTQPPPSAGNQRPVVCVTVRDKAVLSKFGDIHPFAGYAVGADVAIVVCPDQRLENHKGMGILDVAMAVENIRLTAEGLGLGTVCTGNWPLEKRLKDFQTLPWLPETVPPCAVLLTAHPAEPDAHSGASGATFDAARGHSERR